MRTTEEIKTIIDSLKGRQARLQQNYEDFIRDTSKDLEVKSLLTPVVTPMYRGHSTITRWHDEWQAIEDQIRVLLWVSGEIQLFPQA